MAIVVRILVDHADQDAHDKLQEAVEAGISRLGGPPEGLLVHLAHPSDGSLLIVEAWRSEDVFRVWWREVMEPAISEVGLTAGEVEICSLWSLARP